MLSEEDKKQMLEDACDPKRKEVFASARSHSQASTTWADYFVFLKNVNNLFPAQRKSRPITEGSLFKL